MKEIWIFRDHQEGVVEDFESEELALEYLEESLARYRKRAAEDGEWSDSVDHISVLKVMYVTEEFPVGDAVDYRIVMSS